MSPDEKSREKLAFKKALKEFASDLQTYVSSEDGQWAVKGFIDVFRNIYTITADTKIVSKILEIHLFPKLLAFAEENDLKVVLAEKQNWYPDFSFVGNKNSEIKFAVDLKTTYRNPGQARLHKRLHPRKPWGVFYKPGEHEKHPIPLQRLPRSFLPWRDLQPHGCRRLDRHGGLQR
ncbi:MAG TPA: type II restriction endonuclease [Chthoniobacterales bacterium]